jgi:hypothetical protein
MDPIDKFHALVTGILSNERRDALLKLLDSPVGEAFLLSPSGTRVDHEHPVPGGLVMHSLDVLKSARDLQRALGVEAEYDSLVTVCLFHDLGRATDHLGVPRYVQLPGNMTMRYDRGERYEHNRDCADMHPYSEMSLFILASYGVGLSFDETLAIRLADGPLEENRRYRLKEPDLALVLSWAKRWALRRPPSEV